MTFTTAIQITEINCPEEVQQEQDFICELQIEEVNGLYDIKVQIQGGGQTINKIWNNQWQRADWYVTKLVDASDTYKIKLLIDKDYLGNSNGLIRIREAGTKQYLIEETFQTEVVEMLDESEGDEEDEEDEEEGESNMKIRNIKAKEDPIPREETGELIVLTSIEGEKELSQKVINLNSDKSIERTIYESKNEKIKKYSFYIFLPFLILTLILLIFKKW